MTNAASALWASPAEERFWSKVNTTDSCWLWLGALSRQGYGRYRPGGSAPKVTAHRYAYEMLVGPIPTGKQIDHLCRNKACVNPNHLEIVTASQNIDRRDRANEFGVYKVTFICGHPASEENTYHHVASGRRSCKQCARDRMRRNRNKEKS